MRAVSPNEGAWMSNESLSALLDGECTPEELDRTLAEIGRSRELAVAWSRLCLARELREGTRITDIQRCICESVMSAIAAVGADEFRNGSSKVVAIDGWRQPLRRGAKPVAWKPVVGFAAAASVGVAAVLLLAPARWAGPPSGAGAVVAAADTLAPELGSNAAVASLRPVSLGAPQAQDAEQRRLLREYLMNHSSSVAEQGVGGPLRYARFAAYTTDGAVAGEEQR